MKSILVIGLGRFGTYMAKKFSELGNHVLVLDTDEEKIDEILPYVTSAQIGEFFCNERNVNVFFHDQSSSPSSTMRACRAA